jgi:hypothetical protein
VGASLLSIGEKQCKFGEEKLKKWKVITHWGKCWAIFSATVGNPGQFLDLEHSLFSKEFSGEQDR